MSDSDLAYEQGKKTPLAFWHLGLAVFVVIIVLAITSFHAGRDIDATPLEAELILTKLYTSGTCLARTDTRTHPGEIDPKLFTNEQLASCITGPAYVKAHLVKQEQTIYNDDVLYQRNEPFCKFESHYCLTKLLPVHTPEGIDTLNITVILPQDGRDITRRL